MRRDRYEAVKIGTKTFTAKKFLSCQGLMVEAIDLCALICAFPLLLSPRKSVSPAAKVLRDKGLFDSMDGRANTSPDTDRWVSIRTFHGEGEDHRVPFDCTTLAAEGRLACPETGVDMRGRRARRKVSDCRGRCNPSLTVHRIPAHEP